MNCTLILSNARPTGLVDVLENPLVVSLPNHQGVPSTRPSTGSGPTARDPRGHQKVPALAQTEQLYSRRACYDFAALSPESSTPVLSGVDTLPILDSLAPGQHWATFTPGPLA